MKDARNPENSQKKKDVVIVTSSPRCQDSHNFCHILCTYVVRVTTIFNIIKSYHRRSPTEDYSEGRSLVTCMPYFVNIQ